MMRKTFMDADGDIYETYTDRNGQEHRVLVSDDDGWVDRGFKDAEAVAGKALKKIEDNLKAPVVTLGDVQYRIRNVFKLMNWYASGDHLNQWSRADPQSVLGEVYIALAPVQMALEGMDDPEEGFAKKQYERKTKALKAEYSKTVSAMKKEYATRLKELRDRQDERVAEVELECSLRIAAREAELDSEVERRVEAELQRLRDIQNGSLRNANGRAIRL